STTRGSGSRPPSSAAFSIRSSARSPRRITAAWGSGCGSRKNSPRRWVEPLPSRANSMSAPPSPWSFRWTMANPTILIVDDDRDLLDSLASLLELEGYRVIAADSGARALAALIAEPPPDIILLDLMMPVMDGWEFRAQQRQAAGGSEVPVIVMTAGHS